MTQGLQPTYAEDCPGFDATPGGHRCQGLESVIQAMVDASTSSTAVLDESGDILQVNTAWRRFADQHGFEGERYGVGLNYLEICKAASGASSAEAVAVAEGLRRVLVGKEIEFHQEYCCQNSAFLRWFIIRASRFALPGADGAFRVLVAHEDITYTRQAEANLLDLGGRLINAQEEERSRLARELHDDLSQRLALLSIELEQLSQKTPKRQHNLRARMQDLREKAQEISLEVHRLSYQLHPSKLDHLGLAAALNSFCDELSARHAIKIEFRHGGVPLILPKDVSLCIFRIAQESLNNVVKHSGARGAEVVLGVAGHAVNLSVSDSGAGFDVESDTHKKGLGLISMRERLRLVGGELTIRSQLARGTRIDVRVPLADANTKSEITTASSEPGDSSACP